MSQKDDTTRVTALNVLGAIPGGSDCLIEIYGRHLGRKYDLRDNICLIGRDAQNNVVLESDSVSRRHAALEVSEAGRVLRDLGSTNGSYLNDIQVRSALLTNGDLVKIGDTIFKYLVGANIESLYHEEIYNMTISDGLTQIANKRHFQEYMDKEFARARRYGRDLSLIMFDLDHFKQINDTLGHLTGDYVLKELATAIRPRIRAEELFARYGGEEFVVVLPEATLQSTVEFGEAVRSLVQEHRFEFERQSIRITLSVGVGVMGPSIHAADDLIKEADLNLYEAKRLGRNRIHSSLRLPPKADGASPVPG